MLLRSLLAAIVIASIAGTAPVLAAEAYPTKPIRIIVPFPPGGSNDIIGRFIGQKLSARLGQQVVIDNRAGADAIIGTALAANAAPDGYTFLIVSTTYTMTPATHKKLPYDPLKSLTPVNTLLPVLPLARSGRLKILGVTSAKRTSILPDVPTIAEAGVPGYEASIWWGLLGPAGMPRDIVTRINSEVSAILGDAETVKWFTLQAADPMIATPDDFRRLIAGDIVKWSKVAKEAGISMQ